MFTGIIEEIGTVQKLQPILNGLELTILSKTLLPDLKIGDSIAVNGACTTVTQKNASNFTVQLSSETLQKTTFSQMQTQTPVNLETSLTLSSKLGGHLVSGHVDGIGTIIKWNQMPTFRVLEIEIDSSYNHYLIPKGSITINGISLTIAELSNTTIQCHIVPQTIDSTTLSTQTAGNLVNIEYDLIGKYLYRFYSLGKKINRQETDQSLKQSLEKAGFMI